MSKLKVDEIRQSTRSVSDSANITLANDGTLSTGNLKIPDGGTIGSASDADAISISSAGKVGIGTTTPANDLEIGAYSGDKTLSLTSGTNGNTFIRMSDGDSSEGMFLKTTGAASIAAMTMNIGRNWGGDTTLVTVLGSGQVGIGTTSPSNLLEVHGTGNQSAWLTLNSGASNYNAGILFKSAGTNKWFMYNDGSTDNMRITDYNDQQGVTLGQNDTNGWGVVSDDRMKKDWVNFENALPKINSLTKIGNYRRIDPVTGEYLNNDPNEIGIGLSAQEVQSILPNSISTIRRNPKVCPDDENEYLVLHYQSVGVLAIKAIQELSAKVTELENKYATNN